MTKNKTQPKNWRRVKLGNIGKIITGKTPSTKEPKNFGGRFPFITIPDLKDQRFISKTERTISEKGVQSMKTLKLPANSVVMSCLATAGETGITIKESFTNQQINSVICNPEIIDYRFLYYTFRRLKKVMLSYGGSVYTNISKSKFSELEIEVPQIMDQKQIADILSAFDDKIELNNKINQNLEQMTQAIFKEWFGNKEKNGKVSDLMSIISGFPFSSKIYSRSGLGVVTIKNVQDGSFVRNFDSFIKEENLPNKLSADCLLKNGDVLLSLTGNVGRVCFVYGGEYLLNQRVAKIKPKNKTDLAFCYFLFRQSSMQNYLINMAKGSAQPNLSPVETGKIEIFVPEKNVLDSFNDNVAPIYQTIVKNAEENQKLASLRDLLLPKLMSGEIRV